MPTRGQLAAQEADALWEASIRGLSDGYVLAVEQLAAGHAEEALDAFRTKYLVAVKQLFSETLNTQPESFTGVADWSGWLRQLYVRSVQAEKLLSAKPEKDTEDWAKAQAKLESIRTHFALLRNQSRTQTTGDVIYALRQETRKSAPSVAALKNLEAQLARVPKSRAAWTRVPSYWAARNEWEKALKPALAQEPIDRDTLETLRAAAEKFYQAFGKQLD